MHSKRLVMRATLVVIVHLRVWSATMIRKKCSLQTSKKAHWATWSPRMNLIPTCTTFLISMGPMILGCTMINSSVMQTTALIRMVVTLAEEAKTRMRQKLPSNLTGGTRHTIGCQRMWGRLSMWPSWRVNTPNFGTDCKLWTTRYSFFEASSTRGCRPTRGSS